jgi:hypothetical protein
LLSENPPPSSEKDTQMGSEIVLLKKERMNFEKDENH